MVSTVSKARSKLHDQYTALRLKILNYYRLLPLVGREAGAKAYQLPPKLGHWHWRHRDVVGAACAELDSTVRAIEELVAQRAAEVIAAKHVPRRLGGRRKRSAYISQQPTLIGEWPPRKM